MRRSRTRRREGKEKRADLEQLLAWGAVGELNGERERAYHCEDVLGVGVLWEGEGTQLNYDCGYSLRIVCWC